MLNYSFPCSCSKNLSSFWLVLKQQWTIEEISIFSNSSHLEWRAGLLDTISKGTHPRTIPARFGLIWFRSFRREDLNVKVYDVRRTDARWCQKLTWPLARWDKNVKILQTEKQSDRQWMRTDGKNWNDRFYAARRNQTYTFQTAVNSIIDVSKGFLMIISSNNKTLNAHLLASVITGCHYT